MIKIKLSGITMKVLEHKNHLELSLLIVAEEKRGAGIGSSAIRCLQQFGRTIRLTACPGVGHKKALHRFYRRLGFRAAGRDVTGYTNFVWTPGGAK